MGTPTIQPLPPLSPTFCYTPFALSSFLRVSRSLVDDPISQALSAFAQPSTKPLPFSPSATGRTASTSRLTEGTCSGFVAKVLLPAWRDRATVLRYCGDVADQDPGEERGVKGVVDERLDPYSARESVGEGRAEGLARVVREEGEVERIVRMRSWGVLRTRCEGLVGEWSDVAPLPDLVDGRSGGE